MHPFFIQRYAPFLSVTVTRCSYRRMDSRLVTRSVGLRVQDSSLYILMHFKYDVLQRLCVRAV